MINLEPFKSTTRAYKICRHCSRRFLAERHWQIFCAAKCKKDFHYYKKTPCFYCGEYCARMACKECTDLSVTFYGNERGKMQHLISAYVKKYKLRESVTEWDKEDMEDIGAALSGYIKRALVERRLAENKVMHIRYVAERLSARVTCIDDLL